MTGVDVRLRSAGGPVSLKSLVGKRAEVDSGGGAVSLGACYADQLHVQSGEGVACSGVQTTRGQGRTDAPLLRAALRLRLVCFPLRQRQGSLCRCFVFMI